MPLQTDEQKKLAENAAKELGFGSVAGAGQELGLEPIQSDALKPTNALDVSQTQAELEPTTKLDEVIKGQFDILQNEHEGRAAEAAVEGSSRSIEDLISQSFGETELTQQEEQRVGLPGIESRLNESLNQLRRLSAESLSIPLEVQEESVGRGRTAAGVAPITTGRLRQNAIKALTVGAEAAALQGRFNDARDAVQEAVNIRFERQERNIAIARELYKRNKESLDRIDKKRSDALSIALAQQGQALKNQREDMSTIQNMALHAVTNFPEDPNVRAAADRAMELGSVRGALSLLGQYQANPQEIEDALLDREFRKAQLAKLNAEQAKIWASIENSESAGTISTYQRERSIRNLQSIAELETRVTGFTTGIGSLLSVIPGTEARDFSADLSTLKANIAFGELTAMREASKTGGALGQVSDREGRLLQEALGALDEGQSPANIRKNLQKIEDSINRWYEAVGEAPPDVQIESGNGGVFLAPDGTEVIIID